MISDKIREAREWGKCVDTLKASVDSMYEICRIQQNIMGCEEAIMFLKHAIRDFDGLIDTIKIEQNWDSEERPMTSLAWEIRGTVSRNSLLQTKEKQCQTQQHQAQPQIVVPPETNSKTTEDEWQVVQRRKSTLRQNSIESEKWVATVPFGRPQMGFGKAPKSAMDLPQTKSSMAKMAYSRHLLFEKNRKLFLETLNSNKRKKRPNQQQQKIPLQVKGTILEDIGGNKQSSRENSDNKPTFQKQKSEPPPDCLKILIDKLSDDCEWRAMTEEEESLAQEEESLKKEIEEEENLSPFEDEMLEEEINKKSQTPAAENDAINLDEKQSSSLTNHYWNPGEIAQLRAKLLSPTKRRKMDELDSENKLKRAEELRHALQRERSERLQLLNQRVEEVRKKREEIQQRKKAHLEIIKERIQRAGENRLKGIEEIIQRAQEDELKIMEINLLNNFEAANKKLEKRYTQIRERNRYNKLVQSVEEERQKRIEENKQQKFAAEQRRKNAEEQRLKRLKDQHDQHEQRQCHALKHRVITVEKYRAKVAQHSQRVNERKARELAEKQQLLDKIQHKQEKQLENYENCKGQVRRKAMELSSPRPCHLWAQTLADFNQPPSDLSLHGQQQPQRPASTILDQSQALPTKIYSKIDNLPCNRCKAKINSDLQLISHVLSDDHLKFSGIEPMNILQNSGLNYDFLRNELGRIIGTFEEGTNSQTSSFTAEMDSSMVEGIGMSDSLSSVEIQPLLASSSTTIEKAPTMAQIIGRNAEKYLLDERMKRNFLGAKMEKGQQENGKEGKAGGINESAAMKKKRARLRQKYQREFNCIDQIGQQNNSNTFPASTLPKEVKKAVNAALNSLKDFGSKTSPILPNELHAIEQAIMELLNQTATGKNSDGKNFLIILRHFYETDLIGQLLAVCLRIEQQRNEMRTVDSGNGKGKKQQQLQANSPEFSRFIQKCLRLLSQMLKNGHQTDGGFNETKLMLFNAKAIFSICEMFQINAKRMISMPISSTSTDIMMINKNAAINLESKYISLSILQIITQIPSPVGILLFTYLCFSCSSLLEFLSHIAMLEIGEICADLQNPNEFFGQQQQPTSTSMCQILTNFLCEFLIRDKTRTASLNPLSQRDSSLNGEIGTNKTSTQTNNNGTIEAINNNNMQQFIEKLRFCCLLWLYSLCIHAYHQFGHFFCPPENLHSSPDANSNSPVTPASPTKEQLNKFPILYKSILQMLNTMAEQKEGNFLHVFLEMEMEKIMTVRMACILRTILQLLAKHEKALLIEGEQQLLLKECIKAVGYFAKESPSNQFLCVFGWHRSILTSLCTLPLDFFYFSPLRHFILPTLIAILHRGHLGIESIRGKFCLHYLIGYLETAIKSKPNNPQLPIADDFKFLSKMIPSNQWEEVKRIFELNNPNTSNEF